MRWSLKILLVIAATAPGLAADDAPKNAPLPHDTVQLRAEVNDMETVLANERNQQQVAQKLLDQRRAYDDVLRQLEGATKRKDTEGITHWQERKRFYDSQVQFDATNTVPVLEQKVNDLNERIAEHAAQLRLKQNELDRRTNVDLTAQEFKKTISFYSALLVFSVILGFYLLAGFDPEMRRTVFRGDVGIQFLALFSVVIAIILFGITGVLEGKELAGLLGSLSGYLLGRVTAHAPTADRGQQ